MFQLCGEAPFHWAKAQLVANSQSLRAVFAPPHPARGGVENQPSHMRAFCVGMCGGMAVWWVP